MRRSRNFGKRGSGATEDTTITIWEAVVAGIFALFMLGTIYSVVSNNNYWKIYYTTDLSLVANIESVNRGDFNINYVLKDTPVILKIIGEKNYEIILKKGLVQIYDLPKKNSDTPAFQPYGVNSHTNIVPINTIQRSFSIVKTGQSMTLKESVISGYSGCPTNNAGQRLKMATVSSIGGNAQIVGMTQQKLGLLYDSRSQEEVTLFFDEGLTDKISVEYPKDMASYTIACRLQEELTKKGLKAESKPYNSLDTRINSQTSTFIIIKIPQPVSVTSVTSISSITPIDTVSNAIKTVFEGYYVT